MVWVGFFVAAGGFRCITSHLLLREVPLTSQTGLRRRGGAGGVEGRSLFLAALFRENDLFPRVKARFLDSHGRYGL